MGMTDLHIPSGDNLQDSNENQSNLDEVVAKLLEDKRIDAADKTAIDDLHTALTGSEKKLFSQSREALKDIFRWVLEKGYDVKGQDAKDQLQKILTLAGLNYDIDGIYQVNKEYLRTPERYYSRHPRQAANSPLTLASAAIEPEDKTFTFKVENGLLKIYEHQEWDLEWNDFIGYVQGNNPILVLNPWYEIMLDELNLSDNGTTDANADTLLKALHEDTIKNDIALLKAQNEAQAGEIQLLKDADTDTLRKINDINTKILQIREDIKNLKERIGTINTTLSEVETKYNELLAKQEYLTKEINALQTRVGNAETKNTELENIISQLKTKLEGIGAEIAAIKAKYEPIIDVETKERTKELDDLTIALEKDIKSQNGTKESFQTRLDEINKEADVIGYPKAGRELLQKWILEYPDTPEGPQQEEETEKVSDFKLNNPLKPLDWNKDILPTLTSKTDLVNLLKKFEGKKFPKDLNDSTLYAYAVQSAISFLSPENTLGNIDGLWGTKSAWALEKVQKEILGFIGEEVDGKPGKNTVQSLLKKLQ